MQMLALDGAKIGIALLITLFLGISVLMVLVVLIQRPQGGGLSGAFGSSSEGAGQTAFGAKVGDALTTATILIFVLFLVSAVGLNLLIKPPADRAPTIAAPGATETTTDDTATPPPTPPEGETGDSSTPPATDNAPASTDTDPDTDAPVEPVPTDTTPE